MLRFLAYVLQYRLRDEVDLSGVTSRSARRSAWFELLFEQQVIKCLWFSGHEERQGLQKKTITT